MRAAIFALSILFFSTTCAIANTNTEMAAANPCPLPPHVYYFTGDGEQLVPTDLNGHEWTVTGYKFYIDLTTGDDTETWDLTVEPVRDADANSAIVDWHDIGGEDGEFFSPEALEELAAGSYLPQQ